jgi:branched-chain amino acid transport system ATP-binding protein
LDDTKKIVIDIHLKTRVTPALLYKRTQMILEAKKVSKSFGRLEALSGVDLAIENGEIFGIAGPNGAGKSTLFNVLSGTFSPTSGNIVLKGKNITKLNSHRICQLGLARTFQIAQTFPTLNVYDNLRVGATFGGGNKKNIEKVVKDNIAFLGLGTVRDTLASNLDLYTTKLVMIAACLSTRCKVLMLDEPLAGLSMPEINNFLEVVRIINQEQEITILIIEHILDSLIAVSDRMLILHNGEVVCCGDPEDVCSDRKVVECYLGEGEVSE